MKCTGSRSPSWSFAALAETFVTITISRYGILRGRAVKGNLPGSALRTGFACAAFVLAQAASAQGLPLERIKLPPGFEISVFADGVAQARSLALGKGNVLFVGTRADRVYAVRYREAKAVQVITLASDLRMPNGVALRDGALYVAEVNRILRFDDIEARLDVPVGAPCNICDPDPARYALISRIQPDGSGYEVFARGVRNSVGFDWDPRTKELWFTDNGRDMLGDDLPSDELNHAPKPDMHFGYPYCHQGDTADPDFGRKRPCSEFAPPAVKLGPHVASLGMRFYTGTSFPAEYRNNIFIAEHGSWNRSKKTGYRVARVVVEGGRVLKHEVFAEGWLQDESVWGRPVDLEVMPDGSLLVSDDHAGAIYRIAYRGR